MQEFQVAAQLIDDCHHLGALAESELLLNRNAALPWFILVPRTALNDILDLPAEQRQRVVDECAAVSAFIKQELGYTKVNFAGLGNVVAQMHLHIIGRSEGDPCWPQPVWGQLPEGKAYAAGQVADWQARLQARLGLVPLPLDV